MHNIRLPVRTEDLRVELTCAGCGYPHLLDGCGLNLEWRRVGCGIRNTLCGFLNVDPLHVKVTEAR